MRLEHSFTVPALPDEAFRILLDIERIAPCMPGATIDSVQADEFSGRVKLKIGPMQVSYKGTGRFVDVDQGEHRATIEASGKETRGAGTARATIVTELREHGEQTDVTLTTDLEITGRPAQFGRGVIAEVGEKIIGQFAECLALELGGTDVAERGEPGPEPVGQPEEGAKRRTPETLDLMNVAGASIAKRMVPVLGVVLVLVLLVLLVRWITG